MDCPACENAMITLELAEVEIDHCVECGGIWLDAGELELLMDDPRKAANLLKSFQEPPSHTEKLRKCPICDKKMAKIVVGPDAPILLLDRCRRGDGLWFDQGELQDVLQRGQLDSESRIQTLLADMFGHDHANDNKEANL